MGVEPQQALSVRDEMSSPSGAGRHSIAHDQAVMGGGNHLANREPVDDFAHLGARPVAVVGEAIAHPCVDGNEPIGDEDLTRLEVIECDLLEREVRQLGQSLRSPGEDPLLTGDGHRGWKVLRFEGAREGGSGPRQIARGR